MRTKLRTQGGETLIVEPSHTFRSVRIWAPGENEGCIVAIPLEMVPAFLTAVCEAQQAILSTDRLTSAAGD